MSEVAMDELSGQCFYCKGAGRLHTCPDRDCEGICNQIRCHVCAGTGKEPDWELRLSVAKAMNLVKPDASVNAFRSACTMNLACARPFDQDIKAAWALLERWFQADESRHAGFGVRHHTYVPNGAVCALWVEERMVAEGKATATEAGFEAAMATAICRALVAAAK